MTLKSWNINMVIPNPATAPVAKIVIGKNFRPTKATSIPKTIALMPRIRGLFKKKREKFVTENTGHAFG